MKFKIVSLLFCFPVNRSFRSNFELCHNWFILLTRFNLFFVVLGFLTITASLPELKSCSISTSLNEKCKRTIEGVKDIFDFDDEKRMVYHPFVTLEVYFGKIVNEHKKYWCDPISKCNKRVKGMSL